MRYQPLFSIAGVVLLILAVATIETQHITWSPSWPVRLALGGGGVLLALGAMMSRSSIQERR